jgi:hypothetical protein
MHRSNHELYSITLSARASITMGGFRSRDAARRLHAVPQTLKLKMPRSRRVFVVHASEVEPLPRVEIQFFAVADCPPVTNAFRVSSLR